ncbi:MAG: hypothetical protein M0Z27_08500 [Thermaerobacter sp.]|jgi:hypothetical protein|nr:hypothetical protein [Thermaerobacter sp.]MDA8146087.1 hypothetical protein [Thermaerobacter sp.]
MQYPAIKLFNGISFVLSWIVAAGFGIWGLVALIGTTAATSQFGASAGIGGFFFGLVELIIIWFIGFLWWLGLRVLPEVFTILVNIEGNTRHPLT